MLAHCAGDGDNKARSPGRAWNKPLKPLRREGRIDPVNPRWTYSYAFHFCMRGCGCIGHPAFPAPSIFRSGEDSRIAWAHPCRGNMLVCPDVIASASDDAIQALNCPLDCFAEPVIGRAFARPVGSQLTGCLIIESEITRLVVPDKRANAPRACAPDDRRRERGPGLRRSRQEGIAASRARRLTAMVRMVA